MGYLLAILAVLVLAELYALALQCRNGHAGLKELSLISRRIPWRPSAVRCRIITAWSWMST